MDLEQLITDLRGPLIGLIASWGAPFQDAEELAADTFAEAFLSAKRFRGDPQDRQATGKWIRGIARNLHRTWQRQRIRSPEELTEEPADKPAESTDREELLLRAMDRLPVDQRRAVLMVYLEDSPVREVAALLGTTEKTVEGRLYQARKRLRELLAATASPGDPS